MYSDQLLVTAHHEAGHAVAATLLQAGVRSAWLYERDGSAGGVTETIEYRGGARAHWRAVRISVAGSVAEKIYSYGGPTIHGVEWFNAEFEPTYWPASGMADWNNAIDRAEKIDADKRNARVLVARAVIDTLFYLQQPRAWKAIEQLAEMLLKFGKISGDSVFAIVKACHY